MKKCLLFSFVCTLLPNFLYAETCGRVVETTKNRDQYLYVKDSKGYVELECGVCYNLMFMAPGHIYKGKTVKDAKMYECKWTFGGIDPRWKETNEMFGVGSAPNNLDDAFKYNDYVYIDCTYKGTMRKGYCEHGKIFDYMDFLRLQAYRADFEYEQAMRNSIEKELQTSQSTQSNVAPAKNTNKPATKTVEERCREYNGGAECSPERLACYKKGSATKWENGQCKCVDTNRTWEYKNNNGQCIANKTAKAANNTALCKTALGDLEIGKSFTDVDLENCKDTEKTETNTGAVASWEIICETGAKVVCKPYTCTDGYELNSENGKCVVKKIQKPETNPVDDAKTKEIEDAKRVLSDFFASTERNKNVWRDADGNFNTARLASDMTAGVVLGTVGGVVSGVVIKKKQVEKGFDALHCTVGGQPVADWGDTFRVGIAK